MGIDIVGRFLGQVAKGGAIGYGKYITSLALKIARQKMGNP
jgi:hypothetical protein